MYSGKWQVWLSKVILGQGVEHLLLEAELRRGGKVAERVESKVYQVIFVY